MRRISLGIGTLLWAGATALLLEDAYRSGHVSIQHLMMPVLTGGTVAAAVLFHHTLASLRIVSALGFLLLALVGSVATVYGTLGRQAEGHDLKVSQAKGINETLALKRETLASAKASHAEALAEVARECRSGFGKNCAGWRTTAEERRAALSRAEGELAGMSAVPVDPRADATVRLAMLLGASDEAWLRSLVAALDPVLLPFFLELGSILFFASGIPHPRGESVSAQAESVSTPEDDVSHTRDEALRDLRGLLASGAVVDGRLLARRWNVSDTTVSRWTSTWERQGLVGRSRDGRSKRPTALPSRRLGPMAARR